MSRYENIVFLDREEDTAEVFKILNKSGIGAAIEYLAQWHHPGEHEVTDQPGAGSSDTVLASDLPQWAGYVLTVNYGLDYIGLEFDTDKG